MRVPDRRGRPLSGVLILDKPAGLSSNRALQSARHLYAAAKAGHTGSLDPLATGVLPLCFGEATKFSRYLLEADKVYHSTFVLGVRTDTGDREGAVIAQAPAEQLTAAEVEAALGRFLGEIEQVPPMYSALKQGGQPLYKLARAGREVLRKPRKVVVHTLELLAFRGGVRPEIELRIACGKGTYIRTIAEELGGALGCGAHVGALRRVGVGAFTEQMAVTLPVLEALQQRRAYADMDALLLPLDAALGELPMVRLTESGGYYLRRGQAVSVANSPSGGMVRVGLESGEFLGLGEILDDGRLAPRRLLVSQPG